MPKLLLISFLIEIVGVLGTLFTDFDGNWSFSLIGFIFFLIIYLKYRNSNARHNYEKETKTQVLNLQKEDEFIKRETGLKNSSIKGANNKKVYGANTTANYINSIKENFESSGIIDKIKNGKLQ